MPVYLLDERLVFPPAAGASREGVVAVGGDLRPERLLLAYSQGIFPWPSEGMPLLWFSPDPRFVLPLGEVHVPRSLKKRIARGGFEVRCDTAFDRVIAACAAKSRPGQGSTWITEEMEIAYRSLHRLGFAHSIECWMDGALAGGLYGVSLGKAFFGESMYTDKDDASKVAFAVLCGQLRSWGFDFVDCQVHTDHLERFGAQEWPRKQFLEQLPATLGSPTRKGPWQFELDAKSAIALLNPPG